VLDLNHHKKDLHWYLRQVERVIINSIADYGYGSAAALHGVVFAAASAAPQVGRISR
jgi:lipoate-protein ligase B